MSSDLINLFSLEIEDPCFSDRSFLELEFQTRLPPFFSPIPFYTLIPPVIKDDFVGSAWPERL